MYSVSNFFLTTFAGGCVFLLRRSQLQAVGQQEVLPGHQGQPQAHPEVLRRLDTQVELLARTKHKDTCPALHNVLTEVEYLQVSWGLTNALGGDTCVIGLQKVLFLTIIANYIMFTLDTYILLLS